MTERQRRQWTTDDVLAVKWLSDARISPDGRHVAYTVRDNFKEDTKSPKSCIWMVDTAGGAARQFTAGPRADRAPRWSPDSETLAFLSDREEDGRFGIYLMPRGGGEAQRLAELKGDV